MESDNLASFPKGGVHPPEFKELAQNLQVETMPVPSEVSLFLKQHVGASCELVVKQKQRPTSPDYYLDDNSPGSLFELFVNKKDYVKEGDLVGSTGPKLGANLHASITGSIQGIVNTLHPMMGKSPSIIISKDPEQKPVMYNVHDWENMSKEELLARIKSAGIVGLGGAGFPADVKANLRPDVKVDTLILNGSECEPYLTCDHRIMLENAREVIEGGKILLKILGINYCAIGVENNKPDAIEALNKVIREDRYSKYKIEVIPLAVKYPQGSADQIMQSITGRVRPSGKRSSAIGIIVQNVYSAKTIYDAVVLNKPLYERVITVSGKGIKRPANILVRIGANIADIVDYLGGTTPDLARVVIGGPMMGFAVSTLHIPVTKTTAGVLFLTKDEIDEKEYGPCIRCGFCLNACPMGLEPNNISIFVEAGRGADTAQFGLENDCFECGSCAYVCPAKRPLVQFIRLARLQIEAAEKEKEARKKKKEEKQNNDKSTN